MFNDYFPDTKFLVLFIMLKDEINKIRAEIGLPIYSNEEIKRAFRKKVIKSGQVCDRELSDSELAPAMIEEIKQIRQGK